MPTHKVLFEYAIALGAVSVLRGGISLLLYRGQSRRPSLAPPRDGLDAWNRGVARWEKLSGKPITVFGLALLSIGLVGFAISA